MEKIFGLWHRHVVPRRPYPPQIYVGPSTRYYGPTQKCAVVKGVEAGPLNYYS